MIEASVSALTALVGVLLYAFTVNPKLQEIGRIMFAAGLLAALLRSATLFKV